MSDTVAQEPRAKTARRTAPTAKQINWRVCLDRTTAQAAAREKYLRGLMGLPEKPAQDEGRADE